MTPELSHGRPNLRVAMSAEPVEDQSKMNGSTCPWCETNLVLRLTADEQTCPECGTTWSYEEEQEEELELAA